MSFTRFHDDPARIIKRNIETSSMNDYIFNVPGNTKTIQSQYFEDPHLRLQKTGGQQMNNMVNVETMLRNSHVKLNRDNVNKNDYKQNSLRTTPITSVNVSQTITNETRTTHPVFEYREKQTHRQNILLKDPQRNIFIPFQNNLDTNILEKDYYNLKNYKKI